MQAATRPKTGGRKAGTPNRPKPSVVGASPETVIFHDKTRARAREAETGQFPAYRLVRTDQLVPYATNARTHTDAQIAKIAVSIKEFGFTNPVLTDGRKGIVAGHGRVLAAQQLGMDVVPSIELSHLSAAQRRAYVLADNRLALDAGWDEALLASELGELSDLGFDLSFTGFSERELVQFMAGGSGLTDPDEAPEIETVAVSQLGDVWLLGKHRLVCGDARTVLPALGRLDALVTDPPYGVDLGTHGGAKDGRQDHVLMKGRYLSYDDTPENFRDIIVPALEMALEATERGAVFSTRNIGLLPQPTALGGIYMSAAHGRGRWGYVSLAPVAFYGTAPDLNKGSKATILESNARCEKNSHPCPKPVAWMEWLISLATRKDETLLDPFSGSGTTIIAAEMTGRICHAIEIEPRYVDVAVRRWQAFTGQQATLDSTGATFDAIAAERLAA